MAYVNLMVGIKETAELDDGAASINADFQSAFGDFNIGTPTVLGGSIFAGHRALLEVDAGDIFHRPAARRRSS